MLLELCLCAGFESLDTTTQRRGPRDAEDVVDAVGATPIENLGAAIMAVGAQEHLGAGASERGSRAAAGARRA